MQTYMMIAATRLRAELSKCLPLPSDWTVTIASARSEASALKDGEAGSRARSGLKSVALQILIAWPIGENAEGVDDDHLADRAAVGSRYGGELALGIDDDDAAMFELQEVREQEAGGFTGTVRAENEGMERAAIVHLAADALGRKKAAEIDGVGRVRAQDRAFALA